MLYGHVHDSHDERLIHQFQNQMRTIQVPTKDGNGLRNIECHMINCFCMYSDYEPLTVDEWIENDRVRRNKVDNMM